DYSTISDVVLHIRYTARDGGAGLRQKCADELATSLSDIEHVSNEKGLARVFSLRHEFPDVFHRLSTSPLGTEIDFTIDARHFPFFLIGKPLTANHAKLRILSPRLSLAGTTLAI